MINNLVELHEVSVILNQKPILWDIDVSFSAGKLIAIVGPNGAGKSTLIKTILGLIPKAHGDIQIFGESYSPKKMNVGYIPQKEQVDFTFPITVKEVVIMGLFRERKLFVPLSTSQKERVEQALFEVGLSDFSDRQIGALSGGQQQRVFMARALAQNAPLYFMDEPFSGVDVASEEKILQTLKEMKNTGKTVIAVHHDLSTVKNNFDEVLVLNIRKLAFGPVALLTDELIAQAFGGRPTLFDEVTHAASRKNITV